MSVLYIFRLGDQEQGPHSFEELLSLEQINGITDDTPIREDSVRGDWENAWSTWGTIKFSHLSKPNPKFKTTERINQKRALTLLREITVYPWLRLGLSVCLVFEIFTLVALIIFAFWDQNYLWQIIVGILSLMSAILFTMMLFVFVDIADAVIRKAE